MKRSSFLKRGFTLIELLLVIGIIAILASIVIVAVNPNKQLGDARNAQRRADINAIMNGVYQYYIDSGSLIANIPLSTNSPAWGEICNDAKTTAGTCPSTLTAGNAFVNLKRLQGTYLVAVPSDPRWSAAAALGGTDATNGTYYFIQKNASNRISVTASGAEVNGVVGQTRYTVTR